MRQLWPQPQANENRAQFSCATASREPIGPFPVFSGEISPRFGIPSSGVHNGRNPLGRPFSFKFLIFPFNDIRNAHNGRHHVISFKLKTSCARILFPNPENFDRQFARCDSSFAPSKLVVTALLSSDGISAPAYALCHLLHTLNRHVLTEDALGDISTHAPRRSELPRKLKFLFLNRWRQPREALLRNLPHNTLNANELREKATLPRVGCSIVGKKAPLSRSTTWRVPTGQNLPCLTLQRL